MWVIAYNAYNNGVQQNFYYSTNAVDWTFITNVESDSTFYGLAANSEAFVLCSKQEEGYFTRSTDGINWTRIPAPPTKPIEDGLAASETAFYLGTIGGTLNLVSFDNGLSWTTTANPFGSGISPKGAGINDTFVAIQSNTGDNFVKRSGSAGGDTNTLTFANNDKLSLFQAGDLVRQDDNAANGTAQIIDVASSTMTVFGGSGTWSANTGNFVIGPNRASTKEVQMFCKLNNSFEVIDLQETNPGYTKYTGTTPTIKFPYYLPNGQSVDNTLLPGSSIYTQIKADNLATPEATKKSNTVTPASTCVAGPIKTAPISNIGTLNGSWNPTINLPSQTWNAITYGDDGFVAIAGSGQYPAAYSSDGINWTDSGTKFSGSCNWIRLAYGNGTYVAVAHNGTNRIAYSNDGINWTQVSDITTRNWYGVAYGNNKFVAVSYNSSYVVTSIDGKAWTITNGNNGSWRNLAFGAGKFVATSFATDIQYSEDGITWTLTTGAAGRWESITYGNGKFVAVSSSNSTNPSVQYSEDGITWTEVPDAPKSTWQSVGYGAGTFVAVDTLQQTMYSYDAINWTVTDLSSFGSQQYKGVAYGDNKFVIVASNDTLRGLWSYTGGGDQPLLTFQNPTGLDELNSGDTIVQDDGLASGTIGSLDASSLTMSVSGSSGTWAVGQTVEGPNRVCPPITFDASDPADIAQFETIKASFEGYDTSKKLHRAGLISRMLVAGFTEQQISAFDLDVADVALSINGYYPLYTTEVLADAAGNGASHAHVIDGVTYYMPDGGVPIYHGNYNEPEDTTSDSTDSSSTDTTDSGSTDSTDSDSTDTTDSDDSGSTDSGSSSSGGSYGY